MNELIFVSRTLFAFQFVMFISCKKCMNFLPHQSEKFHRFISSGELILSFWRKRKTKRFSIEIDSIVFRSQEWRKTQFYLISFRMAFCPFFPKYLFVQVVLDVFLFQILFDFLLQMLHCLFSSCSLWLSCFNGSETEKKKSH